MVITTLLLYNRHPSSVINTIILLPLQVGKANKT